MFSINVFLLSSILSVVYAQARNALHLAGKTLEHPSKESKNKLRRHSSAGDIFASAQPATTSDSTLGESVDTFLA